MKKLLEQKPLILILGSVPETPQLIHALNKDYDIEPYIYAEKRPSIICGMLRFKYFRLRYPESSYYLTHTILDFFNNEARSAQTAVLVPACEKYSDLIKENTELLESSFIILTLPLLKEHLTTFSQKRGFLL